MAAYYNENDLFAAEWLRNLIAAGLIAPGDVDTRSIEDVSPDDLRAYQQCHFFAGIGVWPHALRNAGWSDDRVVWTGSCPCQPFSAAGKRGGASDERHLWPAFFHLLDECRPPVVLGEQVASKDGLNWLDLVQADMEGAGYAFGAADMCAAGVGAPHIRQRLWFVGVADDDDAGLERRRQPGRERAAERAAGQGGVVERLADSDEQQRNGSRYARPGGRGEPADQRTTCALADSDGGNACAEGLQRSGQHGQRAEDASAVRMGDAEIHRQQRQRLRDDARDDSRGGVDGQPRPCPTNGFWQAADWLLCRDDKWRPVEPGTFPLAHGVAGRVGRLRAYGNGLVSEAASTFVGAVMDALGSS